MGLGPLSKRQAPRDSYDGVGTKCQAFERAQGNNFLLFRRFSKNFAHFVDFPKLRSFSKNLADFSQI
jgi:hypothetical protein